MNHSDLGQFATEPPRSRIRVFIPAIDVPEWTVDIDARRRSGASGSGYVTVEDVLRAVVEALSQPVSANRWARDSINPTKAERVSRAFRRRVEKLRSLRPNVNPADDPEHAGVLRIDYLGSQYVFQGLSIQYGQDKSEWARMEVGPDVRR